MPPCIYLVAICYALFVWQAEVRPTVMLLYPMASTMWEVLLPFLVALWCHVVISDPGIIPRRPKGQSAVEDVMRRLEEPFDADTTSVSDFDLSRICHTCWIMKGPRTKHCRVLDSCIEVFDHYCVWVHNSVGAGNHREFVALALFQWIMNVWHISLCGGAVSHLLRIQETEWSLWSFALTALNHPALLVLMLVHLVVIVWCFLLICHQLEGIARNRTTNEQINVPRYPHFWRTVLVETKQGKVWRQAYVNPFNKGVLQNCYLFWTRQRQHQRLDSQEGLVLPAALRGTGGKCSSNTAARPTSTSTSSSSTRGGRIELPTVSVLVKGRQPGALGGVLPVDGEAN